MKIVLAGALAVAVATLAAGCGTTQAPAAPTAPDAPATITETFSGTVAVGGYNFHNFTLTAAPGTVQVTLTAASPPDAVIVGVGIGTPTDTVCVLDFGTGSFVNTAASSAAQITGTVVNKGPICVVVFDIGNMTQPLNYTVSVFHS